VRSVFVNNVLLTLRSELLEEKVSCYTRRPSSLRLTLYFDFQPLTKLLVVEQQPKFNKAIG
jgi:hypothetical protein